MAQYDSVDHAWQESVRASFSDDDPELFGADGAVISAQTVPIPGADEQEAIDERNAALRAICGDSFPMAKLGGGKADDVDEAAWIAWPETLWRQREASMIYPLWIAQRNREFYQGRQWLDSVGIGKRWVSPRAPSDAVRFVVNLIKPAVNLRAQIVSEQRPGFRCEPTNRDPQSKKKAEARQLALDYAWKERNQEAIMSELALWACTDGVSFEETYWDDQAGPIYELMSKERIPLGDVRSRVLRIDEVRVSANATATVAPDWMIVRRVVSTGDAVNRWGDQVATQVPKDGAMVGISAGSVGVWNDTGRQDDRFLDTATLEEYTVYVRPNAYLPNGLELHTVGQKVTYLGELLFGVIPVARFTDGSKDPAYYPAPEMNGWVDDQVGINMLVSKMIESVRRNAGGTFLARPQTITTETRMMGSLSLIEVQGTGALDDVVHALPQQSVGADAVELLKFLVSQFEQKSGWNDATRGSFKADTSGRAILAVREQVERTFAPLVGAFTRGATEDAKIVLAAQTWGYELPREIAITGKSRIDLARLISSEDLDGVSDVMIEPESLMPMPRSLKLFLLQQDFAQGLIPADQYLRLRPFAWMQDVGNGDEDDRARAYRIADAIRRGMPGPQLDQVYPALPMDNAPVQMDILRREILLDDDLPREVKAVAFDRYMVYQTMQAQAMAAMAGPAPQKPGGKPPAFQPQEQPLLGSRPSVAAGPLSLNMSEEASVGPQFDAMSA